MPQIFPPSANTLARVSIFVAVLLVTSLVGGAYLVNKSSVVTKVKLVREQPVPFSHEHHVRGLGIDCRYCHTTVENAASAGMPATYTCMSCHSQIWSESPLLEPVRQSLASGKPIKWNRVHDLPDYAYFYHGIHVQKGIGCTECHGRVDLMPLAWKEKPLTMEWCLDCHRHPEQHIRPKEKVFQMDWSAQKDEGRSQSQLGAELVKKYDIPVDRLTHCSVCHR